MWKDLNVDGKQDLGEPGISGVTVKLYDGNGNLIGSTVTGANGTYGFMNLPPGTYKVCIDPTIPPLVGFVETYDLPLRLTTAQP